MNGINKAIVLTESILRLNNEITWGTRTKQIDGIPYLIVFISHKRKEFINVIGSYDANIRDDVDTANDTVWLKEHLMKKTVDVLSAYGLTQLFVSVAMKNNLFIFNADLTQDNNRRYELHNN